MIKYKDLAIVDEAKVAGEVLVKLELQYMSGLRTVLTDKLDEDTAIDLAKLYSDGIKVILFVGKYGYQLINLDGIATIRISRVMGSALMPEEESDDDEPYDTEDFS
jgi:hypothetical protein